MLQRWRKPRLFIFVSIAFAVFMGLGLFITTEPDAVAGISSWSVNQRMSDGVGLPSAQSGPSIAIGGANGTTVAFAWTDERNTYADIYANVQTTTLPVLNNERVTEVSPMSPIRDYATAVTMDANGFVYIASNYNTSDVFLTRRAAANSYISRTEVTAGSGSSGIYPAMAGLDDGMQTLVWQDRRFISNRWDIYSSVCNGNSMTCTLPVRVNDTITVTGFITNHIYPQIAQLGKTVAAVWEDQRELGAEFPRIYASLSTDGGYTWGANFRVGNPLTFTAMTRPAVAIDTSGNVWVVYEHHAQGLTTPADIYATRWNGAAWSAPVRLDGAPAGRKAANPKIAANGANLFVVWEDFRNSNLKATLMYSRYSGGVWSEGVLSNADSSKYAPVVYGKGNIVWAAWQDNRSGQPDIRAARWNGSAWVDESQINEETIRLSYQSWPLLSRSPSGNIQMTWLDNRQNRTDLFTSRYNRANGTWGAPIQLPNEERGSSLLSYYRNAATAFDSSNKLHAVWAEIKSKSGSQSFLLHSVLDESTSTWSPPKLIYDPVTTTTTTGMAYGVAMDSRNGKTVAAWGWRNPSAYPYTTTLLFASFDGTNWAAPITVAQGLANVSMPSVAVAGNGDTYLAWAGVTPTGTASYLGDIFVARLVSGSSTWGAPVRVNTITSTSTSCIQYWPALHIDSQNVVHVAWSACRQDLSRGIGYARSSDGGASWTPTVFHGGGIFGDSAPSITSRSTAQGTEILLTYGSYVDGTYRHASTRFNASAQEGITNISDIITNRTWSTAYDGEPAALYDQTSGQYLAAFADRRFGAPQIWTSWLSPSSITNCPTPPDPSPLVIDTFDTAKTSLWSYTANQTATLAYCGGKVLRNMGTTGGSYSTFARTAYTLTNAKAAMFDFKLEQPDSNGHYLLHTSNDQNRFGFIAGNGTLYVQTRISGTFASPKTLFDAVRLDSWYHADLYLGRDGKFKVVVTELATGKTASYSQDMPVGLAWRFSNLILRGASYLDNYAETSDLPYQRFLPNTQKFFSRAW